MSAHALYEEFKQALKDVNWVLFDEFCKHQENEESPNLINIGSCGLHIFNGALKIHVTVTEQDLKGILKAMYTLFYDTSTRCADYISIAGSKGFPFSFCMMLWQKVSRTLILLQRKINFY